MKRYILLFLLQTFVFVVIHDYTIWKVDSDTQSEIVVIEHGSVQTDEVCDISKLHHHLHEVLISTDISLHQNRDVVCSASVPMYISSIIPFELHSSLYRPPIA